MLGLDVRFPDGSYGTDPSRGAKTPNPKGVKVDETGRPLYTKTALDSPQVMGFMASQAFEDFFGPGSRELFASTRKGTNDHTNVQITPNQNVRRVENSLDAENSIRNINRQVQVDGSIARNAPQMGTDKTNNELTAPSFKASKYQNEMDAFFQEMEAQDAAKHADLKKQ